MSELDTRIALLLGWKPHCHDCPLWKAPTGFEFGSYLPEWSASLDAQQEILAGLRERGWGFRWSYGDYIEVEAFRRTLSGSEEDHIRAEESDLPKTVATVILAALESEAKG